jgi:hypothetical protein
MACGKKGSVHLLIFLAGFLTCYIVTLFFFTFNDLSGFKSVQRETMAVAENRANAKKGIVLSSQCSGSTWLTSSLDKRPGVRWKDERLRIYSSNSSLWALVSWDMYRTNLETVLSADNGETMIGFKLMYDQIPQHLYAEFANYLDEKQVHVIHLRRRCAALQYASQLQKYMRTIKIPGTLSHFTSQEKVDALPPVPKVVIQDSLGLKRVKVLEENQANFATYLRGLRAPVFELVYEDLDGLHQAKWFNAVLGFLGLNEEETSQESDMLKVGSRLCEDRIDGLGDNDYEALVGLQSRVECSRLRAAGNNESASAMFFPPKKHHCHLAPANTDDCFS